MKKGNNIKEDSAFGPGMMFGVPGPGPSKDTEGIPSNKIKTIFQPGYTTKQRGWGLGLSLVKRIIETYHKGRVFVLKSELGKGTTFRIILQKP